MELNIRFIEAVMAARDLSQKELAERCGMSPQSVNTVLRRGTCEPKTAGKLARGLGVEVADIQADIRQR
ncbi:MAG: helix-turn-helix transcriptional regulator [Oscillibacter sp.]|nr:helix-turn-helix transcriptional regulator [Oscillibacter sp.]